MNVKKNRITFLDISILGKQKNKFYGKGSLNSKKFFPFKLKRNLNKLYKHITVDRCVATKSVLFFSLINLKNLKRNH